jgi:hypothetical protein
LPPLPIGKKTDLTVHLEDSERNPKYQRNKIVKLDNWLRNPDRDLIRLRSIQNLSRAGNQAFAYAGWLAKLKVKGQYGLVRYKNINDAHSRF